MRIGRVAPIWIVALLTTGGLVRAEPAQESAPRAMAVASAPADGPPASQPDDRATSQPAAAEGRPEPFLGILGNQRLTGDWGGVRTALEDKGIEFSLQLTTIYQQNFHGGVRTHRGHDITGRADTQLKLSTEPMGLWKGGTFYTFAESGWNDSIDDRIEDLFGVNAATLGDEEIRVRELWYEQTFLDEKIRVKFGKYDMAVDVDTNAYANYEITQFMNGALVNTGNLPLPDYGIGGVVSVQPTDWFYATFAMGDAQANGDQTGLNTAFHDEDYFLYITEFGFMPLWETSWGKLPGGYRFGIWYDPQPKEEFFNDLGGRRRTIPTKRDDTGFYFNMDQMVFKEKPDNDGDTQGFGLFFRYGLAHGDVNEVEHFWSVGGQYQGLIPTRDNDVLAFGFAQGILSRRLHALENRDRESVYELYYNIELAPWCHVSPDIQYVANPAGGGSRDALVAGLRVQMAF